MDVLFWAALACAAAIALFLGVRRHEWWWALMIGGGVGIVVGAVYTYREIGGKRLVEPQEGDYFAMGVTGLSFALVALVAFALGRVARSGFERLSPSSLPGDRGR